MRGAIVAVIIAAVSLGAGPRVRTTPPFMFPALVIMRGGGLSAPIVLNHTGATGMNVSADTIAMVYSYLSLREPKSADRVRKRRFVEVAEFFGPQYVVYASGAATPPAFERGNHFSRIYLPADGEPALWENPVVAPGSAQLAFYELGDKAIAALEKKGLDLRAARR